MKQISFWLATISIAAITTLACDLPDLSNRSSDDLPPVDPTKILECENNFCDENPDGIDCIARCEVDPEVDGCWYECSPGQDVDCWTLDCVDPTPADPGDPIEPGTSGGMDCEHNFCDENPDGIDCIARCEVDPEVDGCWWECPPGQDTDCWTLECVDPTPADPADPGPEPGTSGGTSGGMGCENNFCDENPDGLDCIARCEVDPEVDGCWWECGPGQDEDCWTLECADPAW